MQSIAAQLSGLSALNQVALPDLWQQEAVAALREGKDVVVHAPTGAGKTLIFELWSNQGRNRGQAIYTVPTRALANDKLAEWRARGWDVGIATGDLADNLDAPVLVATLETQKDRLIQGSGPTLLVIDEYQMIGDQDRGLNYELAIALAPPRTQLLLLSGSVANPHDVVKWLRRLGRDAISVRHDQRPVPLEEVQANNLNFHVPGEIRGYWPRLIAKALAEDLGPILIFAPRRQAAESLAAELARQLPTPNPLTLTLEQKQIAGDNLVKMLKSRVSYHHSGLSYGVRAGVIEPLAKAGQLRVVVATMGLAAGINFSLRSVALAGESYRRDHQEFPLRPDEILQMFGRAGRRGIDEVGFVVVSANEIRLRDGYPAHLSRSGMVDWSTLLGIMAAAADGGQDPFTAAARVQERLFTSKPILLGVEQSLKHPSVPCGLKTDAERARHVRKRVKEMLNSRGEWELLPQFQERPIREIFVGHEESRVSSQEKAIPDPGSAPDSQTIEPKPSEVRLWGHDQAGMSRPLLSILSHQPALEKVGIGQLIAIAEGEHGKTYGRAFTVADLLHQDQVLLVKWIRRLIGWPSRQAPFSVWEDKIAPLIEGRLAQNKTRVVRFMRQQRQILACVSLEELTMRVPVDQYGIPLWKPPERDVMPSDCAACSLVPVCQQLSPATGVAMIWRRLNLVDVSGVPTRRGRIVSFFSQGDGLAIAAGLETEGYALEEMIYDLANLDAGFRFCGDESRWAGRLALVCHEAYGLQTFPGYLENGVPPKYGAGAEVVVVSVHKNPMSKQGWVTELLGSGDIDRAIIEWRSLLRQISHAPSLNWKRWTDLQALAKSILLETESPTITDLPPLDFHQTRRVDHRLTLRRH